MKLPTLEVDRLHADRMRAGLGEVIIGREIIVLDETASTNDVVRQMSADGAMEGLVVFAEHQTAGRGQRGNKWRSAPNKALTLSVLLQPGLPIQASAYLTSWAAETIASTIQTACSIKAVVKPPNDVYLDGRKLAGVLVEMIAQPDTSHLAVLGIGINVNEDAEDFPSDVRERATSIAIETGSRQNRHQLAVSVLRNLDTTYRSVFRCSP